MSSLLAPENTPFAVALALLALISVVQAIGLGHFFPDPDFDGPDFDAGGVETHADFGGGFAGLLGFGRVTLLVWLACLLACFGLLGLSLQQLARDLLGAPVAAPLAAGVTLILSLPVNSGLTRAIGAVWPHDETTAVPIDALVGRRGRISVGRASRGNPARATIYDQHGQMHNVMVEPHPDNISFGEGTEVLLVRREGELFYALDGQGPIRLID